MAGSTFSRLGRRAPSSGRDLSRNLVLNVVADRTGETTVGAVAEETRHGSVVSRMMSGCIQQGCLLREAAQQDDRLTVPRLTPDGKALRERFAREQRQAFEHITRPGPRRGPGRGRSSPHLLGP
ncbi:MarR family transcriptional regulator [Streptomyces sp. NPDC002346]